MSNLESGHECSPQAVALTGYRCELQGLKSEINQTWPLPETVIKHLTIHAPKGEREAALRLACTMQQSNPNVFNVPPEALHEVLARCLKSTSISNKENTQAELKTIEVVQSKRLLLARLAKTDEQLKTLRGRDLLTALQAHPEIADKPHLQSYLSGLETQLNALQNLAATPAESTTISQIIASSTLYLDAGSHADIFADVLAKTDQSPEISETTKQSVHKLFKIPTVQTPDDVQQVLANGYGVDENGQKIPISTGQKLRIFDRTYIYEKPDGDKVFELNLSAGRNIKINYQGSGQNAPLGVGNMMLTGQVIGELGQLSLAEPLFNRGWNITHGGEIDLHFDDIIKARSITQLFFGNMAGFNGRLLDQSQQDYMKKLIQGLSRQGDDATGDNDPERAKADYKELGILNPDGSLNWGQFERAITHLKTVEKNGGKLDFENVKNHLNSK